MKCPRLAVQGMVAISTAEQPSLRLEEVESTIAKACQYCRSVHKILTLP